MKLEEKLVKDAHVLLHPIRFRILELLKEKPMHINAISIAMGMERRLVTYHLAILEEYGFLTSKYEISLEKKSKGKALRIYTVTDKVAKVISELKKEL
ncbi:MAG TPA: winged helix-turn-helix domain-containing protein [Desulfobacteria bacterium]|nr:winged helix-turn-helix domain-containing protein [Desulfobacteria bacterium]